MGNVKQIMGRTLLKPVRQQYYVSEQIMFLCLRRTLKIV
jgi:hypothetical protein